MNPSLVLAVGLGTLAILAAGRFIPSQLLRSVRWTLALVAVAALLDWVVGLIAPGSRWQELAALGMLVALGFLAARSLVAVIVEWLLVQRVGVVMPRLARDVVTLLLYVAVTALVLRYGAGMELGGLALPSAVITVLVGFAMQETLGTLLSGLALAWERKLEAGVWVEIDGLEGAVEELGWRSLVLRTNLDERIVVPNSAAARARMKILGTGDPPVAYPIHLHASYSAPPHAVKKLLDEICRDLPFVVTPPLPRILTRKFDENGVLYECRVWTNEPRRHNDIVDALMVRAHATFRREGIEIPLPQRVVRQPEAAVAVDAVAACRAALERCKLFAGLPPHALEVLANASRWLDFAPSEAVVREGDASRALYVVSAGEAVVMHAGAEVARVGEGEVFGEMAFLAGGTRSATVRAAAALGVVEVDSRALRALLTEHGELAEELAGRMVARRAELEAHDEAAKAPRERRGLAAFLLGQLQKLVAS
jgi:small-conductance mechanosensitive channel/CRP-like cAMP-binding protein